MHWQSRGFAWAIIIPSLVFLLSTPVLSHESREDDGAMKALECVQTGDTVVAQVQQSDQEKPKEKLNFLPSSSEKSAPLEAEKLDKTGAAISKKIDKLSKEASHHLGGWVTATAFYGISWLKLAVCVMLFFGVVLVERIIRAFLQRRLEATSEQAADLRWKRGLLNALSKPVSLFVLAYGTYAALSPLMAQFQEPGGTNLLRAAAGKATDLAGTLSVTWFFYRLVDVAEVQLRHWLGATHPRMDDLLAPLFGQTLRILIVLLGGIIIIQNVTGLEIGPVLASLGLGGLAVALAAKDTIANFFGTLTIIVDRPFQIGEQIVLDKYSGAVESIGFRSTRIRTADGDLVSVPNEKAVNTVVENAGRRPYLRWHTNITINYDSPPEKVERAVHIIAGILENHEGMKEEYPPRVYFNGFKDCSLNIEVFAWYHPAAYWAYQAWLQKTCLRILSEFSKAGIELAVPSSTLYLAGDAERGRALQKPQEGAKNG